MNAQIRQLKHRRRPFPIPFDACRILDLTAEGFVHQVPRFRLSRRRGKVEIMFVVQAGPRERFSWSVTHLTGAALVSFAEARKWVAAYAAGYGQTVVENVKPRMKRPVGVDGKAFRSGQCKEEWLSSDIPQLWA